MDRNPLGRLFAEYHNPWGRKDENSGGQEPNRRPEKRIPFPGKRSGGGGGGGNGGGGFKMPELGRWERRIPYLVVLVLLAFWLSTGFFIVKPDEQAAVLRFGQFHRVVGPGPHLTFPFPVERSFKANVTSVRRLEIGMRSEEARRSSRVMSVGQESLMLTGDENIVDIQVIVQWKVRDIMEYLFNVRNVPDTLMDASEAAVRETMGGETIDNALTTGKLKIQNDIQTQLQKTLNDYSAGISIVSVQLYNVQPPDPVVAAFKDVASAREDKVRFVNQAEGYRNEIIPRTRGEVRQIIEKAEGYRAERVSHADGDVDRFLALFEEYSKAPGVTRDRLLYDALQETLPGTRMFVVSEDMGKGVLPFLPLDRNTLSTGSTSRSNQ